MPARRTLLRLLAFILALAAIAWGGEIIRQATKSDDGGPALAALLMALPSILLLILAGMAWRAGTTPSAVKR